MNRDSVDESGVGRDYWVDVRYVVTGRVKVFAESEADARSLAPWEMVCPATCEVVDYDVLSAERER